jgi:hypothetical protein
MNGQIRQRGGRRSPGFWVGVAGLALIVAAWIDSGWYTSDLVHYETARQVSLAQERGEWIFRRTETPWNRAAPASQGVKPTRSRSSPPAGGTWRWGRLYVPRAVTVVTVDRPLVSRAPHLGMVRQFRLGIAHWFVGAIYLAAWLGLRGWLRRKARSEEAGVAALSSS